MKTEAGVKAVELRELWRRYRMTGADTIAKPNPTQLGDEPVFAFGRERRMHARAYDYWVSLLNGRRMPRVRDMDQRDMESFLSLPGLLSRS